MLKSSREGETESAENVSDAWCDYEKVKGLCLLAPTMDELAWSLGISRTTLWRRMKDDAVLATIIEQTSTHGRKLSLKRMQWQSAAKGDRALLIWLGKQELGQREPDKAIQGAGRGRGQQAPTATSARDTRKIRRREQQSGASSASRYRRLGIR